MVRWWWGCGHVPWNVFRRCALTGHSILGSYPHSTVTRACDWFVSVRQVKRQPGGQPPLRIPIAKPSQTIKLAATMGSLDMALYGVSPSIAATMDKAVKVLLAAAAAAAKSTCTGSPNRLPNHFTDATEGIGAVIPARNREPPQACVGATTVCLHVHTPSGFRFAKPCFSSDIVCRLVSRRSFRAPGSLPPVA